MSNVETDGRDEHRFKRAFVRGLLIVVFLALLVRLVGFTMQFAVRTVQMDFAAFYTAGESVSAGESPYVNLVEQDPPIWDGVSGFAHSRFLYPPLAARPFQVLALLPYYLAKILWMVLSIVALAAALILAFRLVRLEESAENLLSVAILTAVAYPTLTMLERGQIDSIILLIILGALTQMVRRRSCWVAGGLLALATLLKLHCIFLLPFVLIRKRWRVAGGYLAGGLALLALSLVVDGPKRVSDYAFDQLPRIAEHGEGGTPAMALPRESFEPFLAQLAPGFTPKDGRMYRRTAFRFVLNASLVQTPVGVAIRDTAERAGIKMSPSAVSVILLAIAAVVVFFWQRRYGPPGSPDDPAGEFVYWQIALTLMLICAPITWSMTAIWLLPVSVIVLVMAPRLGGTGEVVALLICSVGLLAVVVPDPYATFVLTPFAREWMDHKYVVGEVLCAAGLLLLWRQRGLRARTARTADGRPS